MACLFGQCDGGTLLTLCVAVNMELQANLM